MIEFHRALRSGTREGIAIVIFGLGDDKTKIKIKPEYFSTTACDY